MKTSLILSLTLINIATAASGAVKWWEQDTICRLDPSNCYTSMGIGFEPEYWDDTSKCWGQKIICGNAQEPSSDENKAMTKKDIAARKNINSDYNTDNLNGDCFGARKTTSNGLFATLNGKQVKVFCPGTIENIYAYDETEKLANGYILLRDTEPTCKELAEYEFVNVKNNRCHGKRYEQSKYHIDCEYSDGVRLVIHNGADYTAPQENAPKTQAEADKIFEEMFSAAQALRTPPK